MKAHFPILQQQTNGKPFVYLDSAATAQKPEAVLRAMHEFYTREYANIHRGIYALSARATERYEAVREQIKTFIHAASAQEIVFVRGATEGINLVASSYGRSHLKAGDEVILSTMEHHSNIVPWYLLKQQLGIVIKEIPVLDDGHLDIEAYKKLFSTRTKLVAVTHVSNAIGIINPIKTMIQYAHERDVPVLIDGAQATPHMPVNVQDLDCDFYVFSGHKLYGPSGIGVLYAKEKWLRAMPPYQGGGDMIETVSFEQVSFAKGPQKFEAGTPAIADVIGLGAAINFLTEVSMPCVFQHEQELLTYAEEKLLQLPHCRLIGTAHPKVGVVSFVIEGIHPHDIGTVLDHHGVAVRAGHHCAMPLMKRFKVPATVRASFGIYTEMKDIDALMTGLEDAIAMLGRREGTFDVTTKYKGIN